MFGKKIAETSNTLVAANDIMVLNVTDLLSLASLSTYPIPINGNSTTNQTSADSQSGGDSTSQSKGLSGGAIAGIVIGCVAAV